MTKSTQQKVNSAPVKNSDGSLRRRTKTGRIIILAKDGYTTRTYKRKRHILTEPEEKVHDTKRKAIIAFNSAL